MGDSVDGVKSARRGRRVVEPEQAQHAINVEEQNWTGV